jgi:cellulose synthase/poly-beta-1,6-N-acetylglucosamine synthase-like glycosyltransferase
MNKTIPFVTICIAAYNEAANIRTVLLDVIHQAETTWRRAEILVYADGCTDQTIHHALTVPGVTVIDGAQRKGKIAGIASMVRQATGDVIILFDADIRLEGTDVISHLVDTLYSDDTVVLVGANSRPFPPTSFIERAVYSTFLVFDASRSLSGGNTIFGCTGAGIAMRRQFAFSLQWPAYVLNDDDFLFFSCKQAGYAFRYDDRAIVRYKLPKTITDYIRQTFRSHPRAAQISLSTQFGPMVADAYRRPIGFYLGSIFRSFRIYPIETVYIMLVNLCVMPLYGYVTSRYRLDWFTAVSTK